MSDLESQAASELVQALLEAMNRPGGEDGFTSAELAGICRMPIDRVRVGLRRLKAAGQLEVVTVQRLNLADAMTPRHGYRLRSVEKDAPGGQPGAGWSPPDGQA